MIDRRFLWLVLAFWGEDQLKLLPYCVASMSYIKLCFYTKRQGSIHQHEGYLVSPLGKE